ncbi:hypothetical protein DOY81_003777 [Sarcophaga bullata]|nr:hypothetical protein DOY81_003777 [Sarcophaga bullata]
MNCYTKDLQTNNKCAEILVNNKQKQHRTQISLCQPYRKIKEFKTKKK